MINNFKSFIIYSLCILMISFFSNATEQFIFDVTEIEITKNGNVINGYKEGTAITDDGNKIFAQTFNYNKITNILTATGNVKFENKLKNLIIYSDKIIYFKNEEKVLSKGNSKAITENIVINAKNFNYDKLNNILNANDNVKLVDNEKDVTVLTDDITYFLNEEKILTNGYTQAIIKEGYNFESSDVLYLRNNFELSSQKKSTILDLEKNIYELEKFNYQTNKQFLRGKNIKVFTNSEGKKSDTYFFSEGFFDFLNKNFISKDTKIIAHKDIFKNQENDPRIYGSSSSGDENKTIINKGIFTSCKIKDTCPDWSIKADKITHDKIKKEMHYENALLKIYDVPVFYFPKFFHPDPTVDRRSGFLQPQFNNSKVLGSSLFIPYFNVISESKDYTFKPTIFENNKYILQNEYRQKNKNSTLITDFSLTTGYKSSSEEDKNSISHFFLKYDHDLKLKDFSTSKIKAKIERVSNDTYLKVFNSNLFRTPAMPESTDYMTNKIDLNLINEDYSFNSGIQTYETLGLSDSDKYQYVFPYYDFTKSFELSKLSGLINFYSSGSNDLTDTNSLLTSITNDIEYRSFDQITLSGFRNNFGIYFKNVNTVAKDNINYKSSPELEAMNIFELNSSWPLKKENKKNINETLTPKISFRINPDNDMRNHSVASSIINADNAFSINRLGISDSFEAGKSITLGMDYKFDPKEPTLKKNDEEEIEKKDKYLEIALATVLRDKKEKNIPTSSTINRKQSNLFGTINNNLFENIKLEYNFSLDNDFSTIESNSIDAEISINNFVTSFNLYEQRGEIGTTHIISNTTSYELDENRSFKFSTRRNKEINLTEYYNLSYEYKTDCLTAAIKYNKVFYEDNDLKPTEDLFFTITLIPLTTYERMIYKN